MKYSLTLLSIILMIGIVTAINLNFDNPNIPRVDFDVPTSIASTIINYTDTTVFWAERGTVNTNGAWAWGNGRAPQGSVVGYNNSHVVKIGAECGTVGTTLEVVVRKNGVATSCDVVIGNSANTGYLDDCDVYFNDTDILGIYAGTETGAYNDCVGTVWIERTRTYSGIIGGGSCCNPFNQNLNTTDSPTFQDVDVIDIKLGSSDEHLVYPTLAEVSVGAAGGTSWYSVNFTDYGGTPVNKYIGFYVWKSDTQYGNDWDAGSTLGGWGSPYGFEVSVGSNYGHFVTMNDGTCYVGLAGGNDGDNEYLHVVNPSDGKIYSIQMEQAGILI